MMSYIDLNWDFSQFDRDNSARQHAGGYALIADRVAADVLASPKAARAANALAAADRALVAAQRAIRDHDYLGALAQARAAYHDVVAGARRAGVPVVVPHDDRAGVPVVVGQPSTWTVVAPSGQGSRMRAGSIDLDPRANRKRRMR